MQAAPQCTLHHLPFEFFCEKCCEPACRNCTLTGPHHSSMHALISLPNAYQHRLNQVRGRISCLLERRPALEEEIAVQTQAARELREMQLGGLAENQKYRARMFSELQRAHERIAGQLALEKEDLENRLNKLNDLGHTFQTIQDPIELLGSQASIMQQLKQVCDGLQTCIKQQHQLGELPRELVSLRLDLQQISILSKAIDEKKLVIATILQKLQAGKKLIQKPQVPFEPILAELTENIGRCITHRVCHYCGGPFSITLANTPCTVNTSVLDISTFQGYCLPVPESSRWATRRHFFGTPANPSLFYKSTNPSSFAVHLKALVLRLRTLCALKEIDLQKVFLGADRKKNGSCDKISMEYVLIERCGLNKEECEAVMNICTQQQPGIYMYDPLILRLNELAL